MKHCSIFEPRDQYYQCRSDYSNISCLDNPVWQAHSFWNGAGIGLAASRPGLFISQNARLNNATHRNFRAARSATNSTQQTGQSRNHPGQDGSTASSHAKEFCRLQKVNGAASNDFTRFLTFAAIPPAAFSNTLIVNRLASALEVRV